MRLLVIICVVFLLLLCPVSAKVLTATVDDKEIVDTYGVSFTLHTDTFGDISVFSDVYNRVLIGDNITFSTVSDSMGKYTVYRINGVLI